MDHTESCTPPHWSSSHHSHESSRNSSSIKESSSFPSRRLTIEASQANTISSCDLSPRQSLLHILNDKGIVAVPQIETTIPLLRKYIQRTTEKLLNSFEHFLKFSKQIIAFEIVVQKDQEAISKIEDEILHEIEGISFQGLENDVFIQQKVEFKKCIDKIIELHETISGCHQSISNNLSNTLCPVVMYFNSNGIEKIVKFTKELMSLEMLIKNIYKNSAICKRICEKNENISLEELFIEIISLFNVYIPLFESDRLDIQRKIEVQELLIQFKGTTSCHTLVNDSISLSDLVWAKSNLSTAALFTSQLLQSVGNLETFLIAHDFINSFKAACQYNPSVEVFNPLFEQISEDKIIHAGIAFLKLQTNDDICRYQKCYLFLTTIGLLVLFVYSGNIVLPCDFINAKKLTNADIEIILPQDNAFAADLHISFKDTNYKKEFYFAFQHDCEVIEWSSILKESLPILDVVTLSNFEIENCVATKIINKKMVSKKSKYVGSSIEELVQLQQTSSCIDVVPDVFNKCINEIINKGLMEDGLFRKPPDQYQLEELMKKLNDVEFRNTLKLKEYPVGTICGLLKSLLMEMNPRFINGESYKLFADISRKKDPDEMRKQIGLFIDSLNIEHRNALGRYLFLMNVIATNKRLNRMGESNLSTAICQCFLPQKDTVDFASIENDSFECLITNYDLFLPKKFDNPTQFPLLVSIIKKQTKTEGVGTLLNIPQKNEIWLIDKTGNVLQMNVNTLQSTVSKIDISIPDIKHVETYKNYIYIGTTSILYMIEIETKNIVKTFEMKKCTALSISQNLLFIGEQNGLIEILNPITLEKNNQIPLKIESSPIVPPITLFSTLGDNLYVTVQSKSDLYIISFTSGKLINTISTPHKNSIVAMSICEEYQTLWSGDYNGMVSVIDCNSGVLLQKYEYPLTYGSVTSIMNIPKYVIVSFISSQILVFSNENNTLITSISTKYMVTSKSAQMVRRNFNGKLMWNIWMEKDDNGDIAVIDVTYPTEVIPTDQRLLTMSSYVENEFIEKTPLGHCFISVNCESKCSVCNNPIQASEESYKCSNCNECVHQKCLEKFSKTHCTIHSQVQPEVINKSK